jgi:hypothetical protein
MKMSKRTKRHARKFLLPLIALAMMSTAMFMEAREVRAHDAPSRAPLRGPAARMTPDLHQR